MKTRTSDPDVQILAHAAATLEHDYPDKTEEDPWAGSPFQWILARASGTKGAIGKRLVASWCAAKGLTVSRCADRGVDRVIGGRRIAIKFSRLWKTGIYKFQQSRDQDYEYAICLGICPSDAHCWVIPKDVVMRHARGQHMGEQARDTHEFSFRPEAPPSWLDPWGGSLSRALAVLQRVSK